MASITITVPDAVVDRILVAFGHWSVDQATLGTWIPADAAAMRQSVKDFVKGRVRDHEAGAAQTNVVTTVTAEIW